MLRLPHQSIPRKSASWCATGTRWPKGSICYNGHQSKNGSDRSQVTPRRIWVSTVILKTSPFANFPERGRNYEPFWVVRCVIFDDEENPVPSETTNPHCRSGTIIMLLGKIQGHCTHHPVHLCNSGLCQNIIRREVILALLQGAHGVRDLAQSFFSDHMTLSVVNIQ